MTWLLAISGRQVVFPTLWHLSVVGGRCRWMAVARARAAEALPLFSRMATAGRRRAVAAAVAAAAAAAVVRWPLPCFSGGRPVACSSSFMWLLPVHGCHRWLLRLHLTPGINPGVKFHLELSTDLNNQGQQGARQPPRLELSDPPAQPPYNHVLTSTLLNPLAGRSLVAAITADTRGSAAGIRGVAAIAASTAIFLSAAHGRSRARCACAVSMLMRSLSHVHARDPLALTLTRGMCTS